MIFLGENGKDPYLEDEGTMWLLHYYLVKTGAATLYHLFFNEFRKERFEFTKEQLLNFLKRKCDEWSMPVSLNSLNADIEVFLKTYLRPKKQSNDIEDDFPGYSLRLMSYKKLINQEMNCGIGLKVKTEKRFRLRFSCTPC